MVRALLLLSILAGTQACWSGLPNDLPASSATAAAASLTLDEVPVGERDALIKVVVAIDDNGPFSHRQDNSVFQNRERRLPVHPAGFWREYTVATPGSSDRGARRLVGGGDHSLHYTRDHYRSFVQVRAADDDAIAPVSP